MAKFKNPPPKNVRLTKNLGNETLCSVIVNNGLADLRANWNTWWDNEKNKRKERQDGSKG